MKIRVGLLALSLFTIIILAFHITGIARIRFLDDLEYIAYDARLRSSLPGGVDPRVVIIDIDEKSLAALGGFPWPREHLAKLTNNLFDVYQTEVVGFDIVFPEKDDDFTLLKLRELANTVQVSDNVLEILNQTSGDEQFAQAIADHNVVLGYAFDANRSSRSVGSLPFPVLNEIDASDTRAPRAERYTANLPEFQSVATGGYFSLLNSVDADGIIRRVPLLNQFSDNLYESFSLAVARNYLGTDLTPIMLSGADSLSELIALDLGFTQVLVDSRTSVFVPYLGPSGSFKYISAVDVINQTVENPDDLAGVIALVGTSASGLVDLRATPVQSVYPGVEVHANVIAGLLDGVFKFQPDWVVGGEFVLIISLGLFLTFLLPFLPAMWMTLVAFGVCALLIGINHYLWVEMNFVLPLANSIFLVVMIFFVNMLYGFFSETKTRMELKKAFGMYIPPEIVDQMKGKTGAEMLASERRDMTVMFTDIRNFTPIAENLDPEQLSEFMNSFLTPLTETIHNHSGAIDKYMGDAIMAFWGAPLQNRNHRLNAIQSALAIRQNIRDINEKHSRRNWPFIRVGIGISSGNVSLGNMGSQFRMAYTVLGDTVNAASRMEGLTKFYDCDIVITESVLEGINGYTFRELDIVRVKGKTQAIKIFEPLGLTSELDSLDVRKAELMSEMLDLYRQMKWDDAEKLLDQLVTLEKSGLYDLYRERINQYRKEPPPADWEGIHSFDTK